MRPSELADWIALDRFMAEERAADERQRADQAEIDARLDAPFGAGGIG